METGSGVYGQIGSINSPTISKEIKTYRSIADRFCKFDTFPHNCGVTAMCLAGHFNEKRKR